MNTTNQNPRISVTELLGTPASTFEETLNASGLNWEPKEDKVGGLDTAIAMPRKKLLYRSDNNQALGIVGSDYRPSDPREFLRTQFEFAEFSKGEVTRAGFIEDRSRAFAFVKLAEIKLPREHRKVGDPVRAYIYSSDGWDGGTPRRSRLYLERLRCTNGMTSKEISASLWVSHTKNSEEQYAVRWKKFLGEITAAVNTMKERYTRLIQTPMTEGEMKTFLAKLVPGDTAQAEKTRVSMLHLFSTGVGNEGNSRWDALNAVTEHTTHLRTFRETDSSSVTTNRFLGVVENSLLNDRAEELLLA